MKQQLGFIGLGRMGKNMVYHLREKGVDVLAYNRTPLTDPDFATVPSIAEMVSKLESPRVVFLMVPNGKPVDDVIGQLLEAGVTTDDIIIDGGNCFYKDSVRRSKELKEKGIQFVDCGTSGGLEGARNGACLMVGGDESTVSSLQWVWDALAIPQGFAYFGPSGSGHFVNGAQRCGIRYESGNR